MIKKIGLYDSGVGGLSVVRAVRKAVPHADMLYAADTCHVPYGGRGFDEIRAFSRGIGDYLVRSGAEMLVIACNISSAVAAGELRALYPHIPVFSMIEFGAAAAADTKGTIGVLATEGTVRSGAYPRALAALGYRGTVIQEACPEFVPLVEQGLTHSDECLEAVRRHCLPLADAETVILGCTHYPLMLDVIRRFLPECRFADPAVFCAERLKAEAIEGKGVLDCRTTGSKTEFERAAGLFVPGITAEELVWHQGVLYEKDN